MKIKKTHFIGTDIEEKKEDTSIVKLNISNLHKAIISRTKSTESDSKIRFLSRFPLMIVHLYIT